MPLRKPSLTRVAIAGIVILVLLATLAMTVNALDIVAALWRQIHQTSPLLASIYLAVLAAFTIASITVLWWLLVPARRTRQQAHQALPDESELRDTLAKHADLGVDVSAAHEELAELETRRGAGAIYVAVYGEISTGKSALIQTLMPAAEVAVDVRGGTTRAVGHYHWEAPSGDCLTFADVPGFNEAGFEELGQAAREEALRAHIAVYVCEGDITRDQWRELERLQQFQKPLIVAINKADRYSDADLSAIETRIRERLDPQAEIRVVPVQAGGEDQVRRVLPDGREEAVSRDRPARIQPMVDALEHMLDARTQKLAELRDGAVFRLAAEKLDSAVAEHRERTAGQVVDKYTRRAVIGALAAITPGSDLVIQGALGTGLVRELCRLYDVRVRQVEVDHLLKYAGSKVRHSSAVILAIAGNAFKAFPGIGTVTGGLMHAVAYGLIFDTLGRALTETLSRQGELRATPTAEAFEEKLSEDLAARAQRIAKIALAERGVGKRE